MQIKVERLTPAVSQISLTVMQAKFFLSKSAKNASFILAAVAKYLLSDLFNRFHLLSYFYVMQQHENGVQNNNAIDESTCNGIHHFPVILSIFRKTGEHRCLQTEDKHSSRTTADDLH